MARILVERQHTLGLEQARERAEHLVQKLAEKYGLSHQWSGDTALLEGKGAKGRLQVEAALIRISIDLNFLLSAMKSSIQSEVERVLDRELAA